MKVLVLTLMKATISTFSAAPWQVGYVSIIVTTCRYTHLLKFVIENFKAISVVMGPKGIVKREWQGQDCHSV